MTDKKINMGIIGLSTRGVYFGSKVFQEIGNYRITCVCDVFPERVESAIKEIGGDITGYTDVDEFLNHPELDAVIIATNDMTHADIAVKSLAKKKHVYLEKPMAQTIEDCDRIVDAYTGEGVFFVGLELRYCTLMQECKKIVQRGDIGKIILANVVDNVSVGGNYYFHGPKRKQSYIKSLVLEKGTHSLDLANWIIDDSPVKVYSSSAMDVFGGDAEDIDCVDCEKGKECPYYRNAVRFIMDYGAEVKETRRDRCVYSKECDTHDNSIVLVDYQNGARLSYIECQFTPEYSREFTFIGDKGKMTAFYNNEQEFKIMVWKRHEKEPVYYYPPKVVSEIDSHGGGDDGILREFSKRIISGKSAMIGIKGARDSAAIAIAAHESCQTGMPVTIPLSRAFEGEEK